ncbi:MAG TPA: DNA modification methylase [Bryobacteraceae bacterium]|nr:DNA modification methylase [Bryobacteraceae bacterium]
MKIEMRLTSSITPYSRNPRKIPQQAIDKVAASIQEFSFRQPIVVDKDGVIVAGHTRWLAAQKLDLEYVPVHVAENLTPAQVREYRLMDNRSHEETSWDENLLGLELLDFKSMGLDMDLTGFDVGEIDDILSQMDIRAGLTDVDAVPDIPETPVSQPGDLWVLDRHRLLCGDATNKLDVSRVLEEGNADMVFCDPPYGVSYTGKTARKLTIQNDDLGAGFYDFLHDACAKILTVTKGAVYICMSSSELHTLFRAFTEAGGHWSTFIIWAKNNFTLGRSDYQRQYEPILYGWPEGSAHYWCGERNQGDVWFVDKPVVNDMHPTMKPVELVEKAIRNSSRGGGLVFDPFGGSGSTLIACETTGRRARLIELDPKYVDVIVRRWQDYTGRKAVLDSDGREFEDITPEQP